MKEDPCEYSYDDYRLHGTVFGSEISRDSIKSVTFMDMLEEMPDTAWDVSWGQDGSVMAWTRQSTDTNSDVEMYDLFIAGKGGVQGRDCRDLFAGYYSVEKINFNSCFDTSKVTDMSWMFDGCESLTELDLSGFDTGKVTNMGGMFWGCSSLVELDVSGFDTNRVTTMISMFGGCSSLTELDLSGFATGKVTYMVRMFGGCSSLTKLDLSGFDTSRVTNMNDMFGGCSSLTELDLSGFDTSSKVYVGGMFDGCGVTAEEARLRIE